VRRNNNGNGGGASGGGGGGGGAVGFSSQPNLIGFDTSEVRFNKKQILNVILIKFLTANNPR
jgi:hypothetical protein